MLLPTELSEGASYRSCSLCSRENKARALVLLSVSPLTVLGAVPCQATAMAEADCLPRLSAVAAGVPAIHSSEFAVQLCYLEMPSVCVSRAPSS